MPKAPPHRAVAGQFRINFNAHPIKSDAMD